MGCGLVVILLCFFNLQYCSILLQYGLEIPCFVFLELPVTIVKKMEDLRLPEGSMASLECELSKQNADVKWLKV